MSARILLVDDEPAVTTGLRRALREECYEVLTRASPRDALDLLRREPIDVVVSDEQMPGMTGSEFLSRVRAHWPDTVRLMLTGHAEPDSMLRAINEGEVYRYLLKPCRPADLIVALRQALEVRYLRVLASRLLSRVRCRERQIENLERRHPGITKLERDGEGGLVLEEPPGTMEDLTEEFRRLLGDDGFTLSVS